MAAQVPSVARTVHYVAYGTPGREFPAGICRAAIITEVYDLHTPHPTGGVYTVNEHGFISEVGLCVLNPTGQFFNRGVPFDPGKERCSCGEDLEHPVHTSMHPDSHDPTDVKIRYRPGTWHWPEFVPPKG